MVAGHCKTLLEDTLDKDVWHMLLYVNINVNVALVNANIVNNMEMPGHDIQNSLYSLT